MFIKVMYQNGETGMVEQDLLDELISKNKIQKFLRSDGWCTIGVDPIRKELRSDYKGPERRKNLKKMAKV